MQDVYVLTEDGQSSRLKRIECANEDLELQRLLDLNHDLLPGEQIWPDDARRWLLVKREMPIKHPGTARDHWSIDFLLIDQDAIPTFVECKRLNDPRSRREVIGQVLEYVANACHYLTAEALQRTAEATAKDRGQDLDQLYARLAPNEDAGLVEFFIAAEANLREGLVRVILFMENSGYEVRSIVEFLNRQLEKTELLLVEAKQYGDGDRRIVVLTLFGFTDRARREHRPSTSIAGRRKWDRREFFADAEQRLGSAEADAMSDVLDRAIAYGFSPTWGTGKTVASFSLKHSDLSQRSIISIQSDGLLALNFEWLNDDERAEEVREALRDLARDVLAFDAPDDYTHRRPSVRLGSWVADGEKVSRLLADIVDRVRQVAGARLM